MLHFPDPFSGLKNLVFVLPGVSLADDSQLKVLRRNFPWLRVTSPNITAPSWGSFHSMTNWFGGIKSQPPVSNLGQV